MIRYFTILVLVLFTLEIYPQPFLEDFDGTSPPGLPAGWTSFSLFGDNGHPCTASGDWKTIDESSFGSCFTDPVTTSAASSPNFVFIGDIVGVPPGDIVEDVILTPVLTGLLSSETYDIKFSLRRADKSPMPTTVTVVVKVQYLPDDGDGIPEPGGDDGSLMDIAGISLTDGSDEAWAGFTEPWTPPADDDFFIGWQALWTEVGETGVCLDDVEISGAPPLPVELYAFTASLINRSVKLDWITQTEINNAGFEVQRKTENNSWQYLSFVEGHGNSNSPKFYNFLDESITKGIYTYRLKQVDLDGGFKFSENVVVDAGEIPGKLVLVQNYPNPFNPITTIKYQIPKQSFVTIRVYDVLGNEVVTLVSEEKPAGEYKVSFAAENMSSGTYLYLLQAGEFIETKKMILLK